MLINTERQSLENRIIGSVLLEGRYQEVAHILTAKNFSQWDQVDNVIIWATIQSMHPSKFINLATVPGELRKLHPDIDHSWYIYTLTGFTANLCNSCMLQTDAFLLLEDCIRKQILKALAAAKKTTLKEKTIVDEIHGFIINPTEDVFDVLSGAIQLCRQNGVNHLMESLIKIETDINKKVHETRKTRQLDAVYHHLKALNQMPLSDKAEMLNIELIEIIKSLMAGCTPTDETFEHLQQLQNSIQLPNQNTKTL